MAVIVAGGSVCARSVFAVDAVDRRPEPNRFSSAAGFTGCGTEASLLSRPSRVSQASR